MERSEKYEQIKEWFDKGFWTANMVKNAVKKGWLTEVEYSEITGEAWT
jgi:hypothetical protein